MNKVEHFQRAREHLDSGEDERLRYAALELRMCLEAIAYSKLKTYAKRLPDSVKKKWQPPQALKALLALEPDADRDFTLRMAREDEAGVPAQEGWRSLGTHRTVKYRWLRKNYNKLGSYLHLSSPFVPSQVPHSFELEKIRAALNDIAEKLEPIVASTMDASLAMTVGFECASCGNQVLCNEASLEKSVTAVCLDPDCATPHEATRNDDGEWVFAIPLLTVACENCESPIGIQKHKLEIGLRITCEACNSEYRIVYGLLREKHEES